MGATDGYVIRIRALRSRRWGAGTYTDTRYADTDREAKKIVAGLKGTRYEPAIAVRVEELHYVVHSRADLGFGEDWQ
ncbi:hypothetical protein [Streptomyces avermitilis]|uniref:hypothetical protein n=1 Tax=Streptomyces avermitilis TaxID=33903 RepID=UPI00381A1316